MFKLIVFVVLAVSAVSGMDCNFGTSDNVFDKIIHTCPRPLIDSSEASYCCPVDQEGTFKCCTLAEFIQSWGIIILVVVVLIIVLSFVISCICCFCCPFCFIYKRRH